MDRATQVSELLADALDDDVQLPASGFLAPLHALSEPQKLVWLPGFLHHGVKP